MRDTHTYADIILIHIDDWSPANSALAILDPVLKRAGIRSQIVKSSEIEQFLDQAEVFGISVMDHTYHSAQKLTQQLQAKTVIWGGWTATALPEFILTENPGVDYVILQEGEKRLVNLLRSFMQPELFESLDGIAYRDEKNEICIRPPVEFVDMDELPLPNDLAIINNVVLIELARGCYGRCRYCQEISRMRFKSAAKAAEEIQFWYEKGLTRFYFGNANSLANGPLLRSLIDELESRALPIEFGLVGRPEDVLRNYDILEKIFQSPNLHLYLIEVGIEANTQHLLDLLGRGASPDINRKAVTALVELQQKYSPETQIMANMILFSHYDMTMEDLIANIRFIGEHRCSKSVMVPRLVGVAGTLIWQDMQARGFQPNPNKGLQINEYPFTDDTVNQLFQKLLSYGRFLYSPREASGKKFTLDDQRAMQGLIHDKILEFYTSGDIMASIMTFIESSEFEKPPLSSLLDVFVARFSHQE